MSKGEPQTGSIMRLFQEIIHFINILQYLVMPGITLIIMYTMITNGSTDLRDEFDLALASNAACYLYNPLIWAITSVLLIFTYKMKFTGSDILRVFLVVLLASHAYLIYRANVYANTIIECMK